MTSARERVLSTAELLEAILSQLTPLNNLLHAQLISRCFHTAITSSPTLQQLLFFRPQNSTDPKQWTLNPLLQKHFVPWFAVVDTFDRWSRPSYVTLKGMDWTTSKRDAFLRADASWRKMLLVQPPPPEIKLTRVTNTDGGDYKQEATVSFRDSPTAGVTMGVVYDVTESFLRKEHASYASFGLFIKDADVGPTISMHFEMTQQCCIYSPIDAELRSEGADAFREASCLRWKEVDDETCFEFASPERLFDS
jgi:hypothetical protein